MSKWHDDFHRRIAEKSMDESEWRAFHVDHGELEPFESDDGSVYESGFRCPCGAKYLNMIGASRKGRDET